MVSRSHQAFYFSQMNMSVKFFGSMGVPGGGTIPRYLHQKDQLFFPKFQMGGLWVVVCLGVRVPKTSLIHDEKFAFFGLRVRGSPKIFTIIQGFGLIIEVLASAKRRPPAHKRR